MHNNNDKKISEKSKLDQLSNFTVDNLDKKLTTNTGLKVSDTDNSLKAGKRGPTLLEDFHFREKITHFDHERIPERAVHARGSGAHGYFEAYEDMSEYTCAKFLSEQGKKTPVFVRFSTVAGSRGSADTVRDARGFATKFYTEDGIFDIVGNNIPVFFIQDAIKFPDIIHAVKPEQDNEIPQASSAHDTFWDFISQNPETTHMVFWVMSGRALPRSFAMMEGFGVNTFRLVNDKGQARFIKWHWKPVLGLSRLLRDEAQKINGKDPDFHRRDLFDSITNGVYPEYELGVQMIEEKDEFKFDFDILDPTKLWPEELVPVKKIGKMTLNKNPDNFFAETEQVAFCPANLVPGIDLSNDPLLQGRLFSYEDTQISRLGGPNFKQIPINRPVNCVHNNTRDAMHQMMIPKGAVAYTNNSLAKNSPHTSTAQEGGYVNYQEKVDGHVIRARSESFSDHFSQAKMFLNSMSEGERAEIIDAFYFELTQVKHPNVREATVDLLANVCEELAKEVAMKAGVRPPLPPKAKSDYSKKSPALSMENYPKTAKGRKVAVVVGEGFCSKSVNGVLEALKQAGVFYTVVGEKVGKLKDKKDGEILVSQDFNTTTSLLFDAVYVADGSFSNKLCCNHLLKMFIQEAYFHLKPIAFCGESKAILESCCLAGEDDKCCSEKKDCSTHGILYSKECSGDFASKFVGEIAYGRHYCRTKTIEKCDCEGEGDQKCKC